MMTCDELKAKLIETNAKIKTLETLQASRRAAGDALKASLLPLTDKSEFLRRLIYAYIYIGRRFRQLQRVFVGTVNETTEYVAIEGDVLYSLIPETNKGELNDGRDLPLPAFAVKAIKAAWISKRSTADAIADAYAKSGIKADEWLATAKDISVLYSLTYAIQNDQYKQRCVT